MPADNGFGTRSSNGNALGLVIPVLVVLSIFVLIAPVPAVVLDLLLATNLTVSVLVLLTTLSVRKPLEFSVFPTVLLLTTLVRLVLNVASTRLILTRAPRFGTDAAGEVIEAFGRFVAQGELLVGLVLFAIVVIIQFVVITKGATRISEVAARFALDSLPGKQLAIDADVAAGFITAEQARERRMELTEQADFYAAMDGAGKFVRGDAIAGILIIGVNLIGGLAIGVLQHGMPVGRAIEVFSTLTIGDGLVSQVPGFLIAVAAGILTTRSSRESNLSRDVVQQSAGDATPVLLAGAFVAAMAFTGLPMLPLLGLGLGCAVLGFSLKKSPTATTNLSTVQSSVPQKVAPAEVAAASPALPRPREVRVEDKLAIEPIEVELGYRLIKLADPDHGGDLLERVTQLRSKVAQELGIILPKVKIRDSIRQKDTGYQIKIRDVSLASGELRMDAVLAINTGFVSGELAGTDAIEPASGRPAKWIDPSLAEHAKTMGYKVVDPIVVLSSHLTEIVKTHADELLTREQVHHLLDNLRRTSPKVVDELVPELLKPSHVHQILCNLLRERVPVRDLETILQSLGDSADRSKDLTILTEAARRSLGRTICQQHRDANRALRVITLDPALEDVLAAGFELSERGPRIKLPLQVIDGVVQELARQTNKLVRAGYPAVVLCTSPIRPLLRQLTQTKLPKLVVLSLDEISRDTQVHSQGQIPIHVVKMPPRRDAEESFRQPILAALT